MHGRNDHLLAWTLAIMISLGATVSASGQENMASPGGGNMAGANVNYAPPANQPNQNYLASNNLNLNAEDASLAARVADLEKTLKKMEDKAKADKEKSASAFTCTPCGRMQVDTAAFHQSGPYLNTTEANGVEFRRLYLGLKGTGFEVMEYVAELDFAGTDTNNASGAFPTTVTSGKIQVKDMYMQVNELPAVGHARVGNFYEPFSIEDVSGDLVTTFMERGNPYLIVPDRHIGVMAFDHILGNENTTWWLGGFCEAGADGGMLFQESTNYTPAAVTGRLTCLPWYDEATQGRGLLHLGTAGSYSGAWGHQYPLASPSLRPEEAHLGKTYAAMMNNIDNVTELNGEMVFIYGPLSVQSEYVGAFAKDFTGHTSPINSFYIYTSYFLTGENRGYDKTNAKMTRVKPFENFFRVRDEDGCVSTGKGAWEVAYRWSWVDFHDAVSATGLGSRFSNHTVGLNWYLNPYTKLMLNDVYSTENQINGTQAYLNTVEMRAQIDF